MGMWFAKPGTPGYASCIIVDEHSFCAVHKKMVLMPEDSPLKAKIQQELIAERVQLNKRRAAHEAASFCPNGDLPPNS